MVASLLYLLSITLAADPADWNKFKEIDGLRVELPGVPKDISPKPIPGMRERVFVFSPEKGVEYTILANDLLEGKSWPKDLLKELPGKMALSVAGGVKGKVVAEKKIAFADGAAGEFTIEYSSQGTARHIRGRVYFTTTELRGVQVAGTKEIAFGKDSDRFLDSIKFDK